jgi:hypothetical protein
VLSDVIHMQAGYPIWKGDVLTLSLPESKRLPEATSYIEGSPLMLATALAVSLAGFVELTAGWDSQTVSRSDCEAIITKILHRKDLSGPLVRFLKDWIAGKRRIFSGSVAPRISWEHAFRGLDEGKTEEILSVSVEVRHELR